MANSQLFRLSFWNVLMKGMNFFPNHGSLLQLLPFFTEEIQTAYDHDPPTLSALSL